MIIFRIPVQTQGGCSFCNEGKLAASGRSLDYPYTHVTYIESERGTVVKVCDQCMKEMCETSHELLEVNKLETPGRAVVNKGKDMLVISEWKQNENAVWYRTIAGSDCNTAKNWMARVESGMAYVRVFAFSEDNEDANNWVSALRGNDDAMAWCDSVLEQLGHYLEDVELLPCAHCGGEAEVYESEDYKKEADHSGASYNDIGVRCTECGVHVHQDDYHANDTKGRETRMIAAWNKRTQIFNNAI